MQTYRKLKKRYRLLHLLVIGTAIIVIWRGVWWALDSYFPADRMVENVLLFVVALAVLYFDNFHLKELE